MSLARKTAGPPDGSPLVTLHGLFASAFNWKTLETHLPEFRWLHLDLRNHGRSPHAPTMSYDEMADDVLESVSDLDQPWLLGHSLGGKVAMRCCQLRPERFRGLIVEDIAPIPYPDSHRITLEAMLSSPLGAHSSRQAVETHLTGKISSLAVVHFLMTNLKHEKDGWHWRCNLNAIARSIHELLDYPGGGKQRSCPTPSTFIFGEDSPYRTDEALSAIPELFVNSQVHCISAVGHWVHHEKPADFARLVREAVTR